MPDSDIPRYDKLMWPTLSGLKKLGGSARQTEIYKQVVEDESFSEEQQKVFRGDIHTSEIEYRLGWALSYLKKIGAIENSSRGVWSLTEKGQTITLAQVATDTKAFRNQLQRRSKQARASHRAAAESADEEVDDWKDQLISEMLNIAPDRFERLPQRFLRQAGFVNVTVLGKSGDGGIDGVGVYRLSLVSFPVYFQCKRYMGPVGSSAVRDFRGAMAGRGEKGLLISTGSFTKNAQNEAGRDGAPPIELIDGDQLCDLLREYGLEVKVHGRVESEVLINHSFFEDFSSVD